MVAVFGESERSEPEMLVQRRLKLELNTAGEQHQFGGFTEEVPPEQPERSIRLNQGQLEHRYIKEEEEEAEISAVTVKREEDKVHLSGFDQSLKEENREDEGAAEAARTSGPEGPLGPDQQQLLKTPSLEQEEAESCDFKVKEEADVVSVKIEGNEEGAEFSQIHQSITDREDCGGPGLARNPGPNGHLGPATEDETNFCESDDSVDWMTPIELLLKTRRNQAAGCEVRDQQQLLKTPSLEQEETGSCDFKVKEEADFIAVKSEGNEEGAEFSQLHQRVTEDCGGPGLARNFGLDGHLGPGPEDKTHSSETEDSDDWMTPLASPSLKTMKTSQTLDGKVRGKTYSEHRKTRVYKSRLTQVSIEFGQKRYSCSDCGKKFKHTCALRRHERIHTGEKPFSCAVCGKRFKRKDELRMHERVHTGEKPFSCSECGKRFTQKRDLRKHERSHTGEKPFNCFECGKTFTTKGYLRLHERVHTGEKPFSCSVCGKEFTLKFNLRVHERIHTGEKPFSCSECGKKCTTKANQRKHERTHWGESI